MPYPSKKFRQNPFTFFSVIRRTDRQTDKQTEVKTYGGGNHNNNTNTCMASFRPNIQRRSIPIKDYQHNIVRMFEGLKRLFVGKY